MAAVVRVKRALDEEPSPAFILSCKRRKTNDEGEDAVETLFTFAGTVSDQKENVAILNSDKLGKEDIKKSTKPVPSISQKSRKDAKASSLSNRFKLVNYFRTVNEAHQTETNDGNQTSITILEVEAQPTDKKIPEAESGSTKDEIPSRQYVYDLYYIQSSNSNEIDVDDLLLDGLVSFAPVENELVFDSYRNNRAAGGDSDSDSPVMDDDDDSNDENNWRNDYPDEEEGESDNEDGLTRGLSKVTFGDEELSSDDDDEKLIYTEELSPSDVNLYGSAYARFKKNALKELDSSCFEVISNSDSDYNLDESNIESE
ncbi:putative RNA polymerase II nuclear localization protein SLC7A6OS [Frankliniella fusca]|uniref:Probable RNA polymerase II nuclear localization protein SLC7A6OS n=1 Tax=Frankliniella fusca TaxID=407009 RepID=A0AAE1GQQ4_9NEOP|nr:putative RNA polymerase II nuclear localization protein SLC7A6OS [Frankliniella fusca]